MMVRGLPRGRFSIRDVKSVLPDAVEYVYMLRGTVCADVLVDRVREFKDDLRETMTSNKTTIGGSRWRMQFCGFADLKQPGVTKAKE